MRNAGRMGSRSVAADSNNCNEKSHPFEMAFQSEDDFFLWKVDGDFVCFALFEAGYFTGWRSSCAYHDINIKDLRQINFEACLTGRIGAEREIDGGRSRGNQVHSCAAYRVVA